MKWKDKKSDRRFKGLSYYNVKPEILSYYYYNNLDRVIKGGATCCVTEIVSDLPRLKLFCLHPEFLVDSNKAYIRISYVSSFQNSFGKARDIRIIYSSIIGYLGNGKFHINLFEKYYEYYV